VKVTYFVIFFVGVAAGATLAVFHLRPRRLTFKGPIAHVENGFEFTAHGPYKSVVPLFGAWAERDWAGGHWNPQFLYPQPARDVEGEVFAVAHSHLHSTWVNTAFDLEAGHIQYVYVIAETQAVRIDIHVRENDASNTAVKVVYERTALHPRFNQQVNELGLKDRNSSKEWQTAIDALLRPSQAR
jgi:hypothetical protein